MPAETATAPSATSEQLIEALAAIHAAASTFHVIHEPDSPAGEFFSGLELRLREEIFGQGPAEGDEWTHDPLEVAIEARSYEFEADALERVEAHEPLGERIRTLRAMGPRVRTLGSTAVMFSGILECSSCHRSTASDYEGWRAVYNRKRDWDDILCPECSAEKGRDDAS
jgi:hypothetical protein